MFRKVFTFFIGLLTVLLVSVFFGFLGFYTDYRNKFFVVDGTHFTDLLETIFLFIISGLVVFLFSRKQGLKNILAFGLLILFFELLFSFVLVPLLPTARYLQELVINEVGPQSVWFSLLNLIVIMPSLFFGGFIGQKINKNIG